MEPLPVDVSVSEEFDAPRVIGTIDGYHFGSLHGWAWYPDDPTRRVELAVLIDHKQVGTVTCDIHRSDLDEVGIGDGCYAFRVPLGGELRTNSKFVVLRPLGGPVDAVYGPVDIEAVCRAHARELAGLLDAGPYIVTEVSSEGSRLVVEGYYVPRHGDPKRAEPTLDGMPPVSISWSALGGPLAAKFWYLDTSEAGFSATFDLSRLPRDSERRSFAFALNDPTEPRGEFLEYRIPSSLEAYVGVPDHARQKRVMGWANDTRFAIYGATHMRMIERIAARYARPYGACARLLDLGVGCGRIIRHTIEAHPHLECHGIDIDADNVDWCVANIPGGHFDVGPLQPPLSFPDGYFDIVHANSVFTHFDEETQDRWLAEIARILSPSGVAILSVSGETAVAYAGMSSEWIAEWRRAGIDSRGVSRDLTGHVADEEYYRNTYHTRDYVLERWNRFGDVLAIERHLFGYQDAVVFRRRLAHAGTTMLPPPLSPPAPAPAMEAYVDLMVRAITNTIYEDPPLPTWGQRTFDKNTRDVGRDWPSLAHSMVGERRLRLTAALLRAVLADDIPGDVIETGIWRGGTCILMRGILKAAGDPTRMVYCADSFDGLPPPDLERYPQDGSQNWHVYRELAVPRAEVERNFSRYGLLDDRVVMVEGLFKHTLPALRHRRFALIRLDGDMYESTMDALDALYDTVPAGGFVVIDDYEIPVCRQAVTDFRARRGILDPLVRTDWTGVWWRKTGWTRPRT